jgi:hypothetical protein
LKTKLTENNRLKPENLKVFVGSWKRKFKGNQQGPHAEKGENL